MSEPITPTTPPAGGSAGAALPPPPPADPVLASGLKALWATFRNILLVVLLIFIFAVLQLFMLGGVCDSGMKTASSMEHQGLPALRHLARLQEHLATYRLNAYEYIFAREEQKNSLAREVDAVAVETRAELKSIQSLFPEGEGRRLAANLERSFDDLEVEFHKVRALVDSDFAAAMREMDTEIPSRTEKVAVAADALNLHVHDVSGAQAGATFGSFGWIKQNTVMFAAGNIVVALGAVLFILVAARSSRAQLQETLRRLDERTRDLAQSNVALQVENTERKKAEESLRLLGTAVEQAQESIMITDAELNLPGPRIIFVNSAFTRITGYRAEEVLGKTPRILQGPLTDRGLMNRLRQNLEQGQVFEGEGTNYRKGGAPFDMEWQIAPLRDASGTIRNFVATQRDITTRKRMERQMMQSQKLETVGKLAGGVAHEFNSILTAIIGQCEMLQADLAPESAQARSTAEISRAAVRAAGLTRQLLAYGRKQFLKPEILDLNQVITGMEGVFRHILGRDVSVKIAPAADLGVVKADAGQIEQVIMNIVLNANEAMPNGGKLTLETRNESIGEDSLGRFPELKPGEYVMLAISDTGTGMNEQVRARIFEPFFTTKGVGEGSGLGLSTCYGIVKQSGGHITVYSEPGRGTILKIYLPQVEHRVKPPARRSGPLGLPGGTETVLLVEDDPALRELAESMLRRLGYRVWAASNGVEALTLKQQRDVGHIDILFTDVVMPHMGGKELAERVQSSHPHTRVLFATAYTENAAFHEGTLENKFALLQKPYSPSALAHKLRELLDQPAG